MKVKIVEITKDNFSYIPRPANNSFNCQECFFWMGKKDGRTNLVKHKKNWFERGEKKYGGPLAKLILWGTRELPIGFVQFGPICEFGTTHLFYKAQDNGVNRTFRENELSLPKGGWCISCVAIQGPYRGKGIATRLIRNVLRDVKRRGVKSIDAYPCTKMKSLNQVSQGPRGLWEKCGFKEVTRVKYEKGEPIPSLKEEEIIVMRKKW